MILLGEYECGRVWKITILWASGLDNEPSQGGVRQPQAERSHARSTLHNRDGVVHPIASIPLDRAKGAAWSRAYPGGRQPHP